MWLGLRIAPTGPKFKTTRSRSKHETMDCSDGAGTQDCPNRVRILDHSDSAGTSDYLDHPDEIVKWLLNPGSLDDQDLVFDIN